MDTNLILLFTDILTKVMFCGIILYILYVMANALYRGFFGKKGNM